MPDLKFTNDLRRKNGTTDTASELADNLQDVEDLLDNNGIDYVNVERRTLLNRHIEPSEGGSAAPLKDVDDATSTSTNHTGGSGVWQSVASVTVTAEAGVTGIYILARARVDGVAAGLALADNVQMRIVTTPGTTFNAVDMGAYAEVYGGGMVTAAEEAQGTSVQVDLEVAITTAASFPIAVEDINLNVLTVNA
jgi:hypothetical protein